MKGNGRGERLLNQPRYKREWRNICAILPAYLPDGTNGTEITYIDGSVEPVEYRLCWVLDDILGHLKSSKAILEKQSRLILGRNARRVPLILCPDFALAPVKGREAVSEYDSTVGYIVLRHVQKLETDTEGMRVWFNKTVAVHVLDSSYTLWRNIQMTEQMNRKLCA